MHVLLQAKSERLSFCNMVSNLLVFQRELLQSHLQFKSAGEATASGDELELIIRADKGDVDRRQYNLPTAAGEVAALLPGEPIAAPRYIVIQHRSDRLQRIAESNGAYDPLHFPLMFPHGETG